MNAATGNSAELSKRAVILPFPTSSAMFMRLRRSSDGSLVISTVSKWRAAMWPATIGAVAYMIPPFARFFHRLFTFGNPAFEDPFFLETAPAFALFIGLAISGAVFLFYWFAGRMTPSTRFDRRMGLMIREPISVRGLDTQIKLHGGRLRLAGSRLKLDRVQMPFEKIRAVQLCYGGREEGDSESPRYDWWQLLVVDEENPPTRAVICQSGNLPALTAMAREVAQFLSVKVVDDSSYRPSAAEAEEIAEEQRKAAEELGCAGDPEDGFKSDSSEPAVGPSSRTRSAWPFLSALLALGLLLGFFWARQRARTVEAFERGYPMPTQLERVSLAELLANPARYNGRVVETAGYIRYVTLVTYGGGEDADVPRSLGLAARPDHDFWFALSPAPINVADRPKGGTMGQTSATNLLIKTHRMMEREFCGSEPITPYRMVIGRYSHVGASHELRLVHWSAEQ